MTEREAEVIVARAVYGLGLAVRVALQAHMTSSVPWRAVLVDGSQFFPAWRAISGLEAVYQADVDGTLTAVIEDGLDELGERVQAFPVGPNEEPLVAWWDKGVLFVGQGA